MAVLTIRGSNDLHGLIDKFPHDAIVYVQMWIVYNDPLSLSLD